MSYTCFRQPQLDLAPGFGRQFHQMLSSAFMESRKDSIHGVNRHLIGARDFRHFLQWTFLLVESGLAHDMMMRRG